MVNLMLDIELRSSACNLEAYDYEYNALIKVTCVLLVTLFFCEYHCIFESFYALLWYSTSFI